MKVETNIQKESSNSKIILNNELGKEEYDKYFNEYISYTEINTYLKETSSENEKQYLKKKEISKIDIQARREENLSMEDALEDIKNKELFTKK